MSTGSTRLDYVVEQVWGRGIARGEARAILTGPVPDGWEVREQYWAVPSAQSAQLLVPVDRRAASRTLVDYARLRPLTTRLARHALASVAGAGAPLSRDTLRIVAPRSAPATAVPELGVRVGIGPEVFATFGVRTAANAKPTLELRDPSGDAVGFVKLAWNSVTRVAVDNEAYALSAYGSACRGDIAAPQVLASGLLDGELPFVMTEPLPRGIRHVPASYSSLSDAEALGPGTVHRRAPIGDAGQVHGVLERLRGVSPLTPASLVARGEDLAARVTGSAVTVPIADFWHGDFVWWNTGRDARGQLWLFDWETAEPDAPAGLDTLHWYAHTRGAEDARSVVTRVGAALEFSTRLLRALGHSSGSVAVLAAWYAVTLVANEIRLAEFLGSWERVKHSPAILEQLLIWGLDQIEGARLPLA